MAKRGGVGGDDDIFLEPMMKARRNRMNHREHREHGEKTETFRYDVEF
jgi:hypothetical protein